MFRTPLRLAILPLAMLCGLTLGMRDTLAAGPLLPGIPDPATSTVPPCLTVCPAGDRSFTVVVRDITPVPLVGKLVQLRLGNCASSVVELCGDCFEPAQYDPVGRTFQRVTNIAGQATFRLCGSVLCPGAGPQWVQVTADGVLLDVVNLVTTDLDADLDVDDQDVAASTAAEGGALPPADQDCSGGVDASDTAVVTAHLGHVCPSAVSAVLITEVEADPVQQIDSPWQWFELLNITGQALTLTNWTIADDQASDVLPAITLGPGQCIVVCGDSARFRESRAGYAGRLVAIGSIGAGLDRVADVLVLRDDAGIVVDCVSWGTSTTCFSPAVTVPATNTVATLQRASTIDTDTAADWTSNANETPCPSVVGVSDPPSTAGELAIAITPNPSFGQTTISCSGFVGSTVVVAIHDAAGRRVRTLRDEGSGPIRNLAWDGHDEQGRAVPAGVYLVKLAARHGSAASARLLLLR